MEVKKLHTHLAATMRRVVRVCLFLLCVCFGSVAGAALDAGTRYQFLCFSPFGDLYFDAYPVCGSMAQAYVHELMRVHGNVRYSIPPTTGTETQIFDEFYVDGGCDFYTFDDAVGGTIYASQYNVGA